MNTLLPLGAAAAIEGSGNSDLEPLSLALFAYGLAVGPFTGHYYFQDYRRALLRTSANVVAGSLMLIGAGTLVGNLFNTEEDGTEIFVLGWMGMTAGGIGLFGNSIFGIRDIPKAKERFLSRLNPSLSCRQTRDGKRVFAFGLDFGLP